VSAKVKVKVEVEVEVSRQTDGLELGLSANWSSAVTELFSLSFEKARRPSGSCATLDCVAKEAERAHSA